MINIRHIRIYKMFICSSMKCSCFLADLEDNVLCYVVCTGSFSKVVLSHIVEWWDGDFSGSICCTGAYFAKQNQLCSCAALSSQPESFIVGGVCLLTVDEGRSIQHHLTVQCTISGVPQCSGCIFGISQVEYIVLMAAHWGGIRHYPTPVQYNFMNWGQAVIFVIIARNHARQE